MTLISEEQSYNSQGKKVITNIKFKIQERKDRILRLIAKFREKTNNPEIADLEFCTKVILLRRKKIIILRLNSKLCKKGHHSEINFIIPS